MSDWEEHDDDAVGVIDLEQEGGVAHEEDGVLHHSHLPGPLVSRDGCTVGRYNSWLVRDQNRAQADDLRTQEALWKQRYDSSTAAYAEKRRLRTQSLRQQHTLAQHGSRDCRQSTQLCAPPMAPRWTLRGAASVCNAPR